MNRRLFDKAMLDNNMSISELSRQSGVTRTTIYYMMSGKQCNLLTVFRLAFVLDVDGDRLAERVAK
jgi:predicted transcriptional regulator